MNHKNIPLVIIWLAVASTAHSQVLKKLKKKAEQAVVRTVLNKTDEIVSQKTENTIDDVTQGDNENKDKNAGDADVVAMQSNWKDLETGKPQTSYHDSEGFFISYNESEQRYNKTSLMAMEGMNMMAPSIMASAYKLPSGAIWETMEAMKNSGLKIYPFMHVDFPFVFKPEHFRDEMVASQYNESTQTCRGNPGCMKFSVLEAGYEGSYTLFDDNGRLVEINIVVKDDPHYGSGKGKIEYFYEEYDVNVPDAVEKKMLGQDLFNMGLDPTKN